MGKLRCRHESAINWAGTRLVRAGVFLAQYGNESNQVRCGGGHQLAGAACSHKGPYERAFLEGEHNMAMSVGKGHGHRLGGFDRLMATAANLTSRPSGSRSHASRVPSRWKVERGTTRATASVDVIGGFPGSIRSANLLTRLALTTTDRYLVVGEGIGEGFAIRLEDVLGAGIVRSPARSTPGLSIRYQDGDAVRTFGLRFRGISRSISGEFRAERVLRALAAVGVPELDERRIAGPTRIAMTWDEARSRGNEYLLWSGAATAAVGGWFGSRRNTCRVWLTTSSLFWCCREGQGINRLDIADITGVRVGPFDTVLVSTCDGMGHQFDLPFVFDLRTDDQDPEALMAAFIDALRESGVPASQAAPPQAPWLRGGVVSR
jgi:hypothetical protein